MPKHWWVLAVVDQPAVRIELYTPFIEVMAVEADLSISSPEPESVGEKSSIDWLHDANASAANEMMLYIAFFIVVSSLG